MDQVRKILDTIVDFIENYINLIKDFIEKLPYFKELILGQDDGQPIA